MANDGKPEITIGDPHNILASFARIELAGCVMVVPTTVQGCAQPMDMVVAQLVLLGAHLANALGELQQIVASIVPQDPGIMLRSTSLQAAVDRLHKITAAIEQGRAQAAAAAAAQAAAAADA